MLSVKILCYILFAYGFSNMVVYARGPWGIFEKWRSLSHSINESFGELFTCMMCFSTWVGILFSLINTYAVSDVAFTPFNIVFGTGGEHVVLKTFLDLCATSGAVWLLHNMEEAFERHWAYTNTEEEDG